MADSIETGSASAKRRVVVLCDGGANAFLVVNILSAHFPDLHVVAETPESKGEIFRRRARRQGRLDAFGQLATMALAKLIRRVSQARVAEIVASTGHRAEFPPTVSITSVPGANSAECVEALRRLAPDVVLLVSTRILTAATLASIPCPVVNLHAGINPAYRGQMGGYWSLALRDPDNFGATIHLVDAGTDTGATLREIRATPSARDNISTYPLLLTATAMPAIVETLGEVLRGDAKPYVPRGPSALRFPPPIWLWIWYAVTRRVW
ncbi:formyl transferase [Pseudomonas sp. R2.Fl]|nr:formyl transferase [Pseudomonas sp. R2.Fl]